MDLQIEILEFIDKFKASKEYLLWKELDNKLYLDKDLYPLFKQKEEMEKNLNNFIYGSKEYEQYLQSYFLFVNKIKENKLVKEYLQSYDKIKDIKSILENELLLKIL